MSNRKKILSAAVAFVMIFSIAFSVLFIAAEAEHSCPLSDCRICRQINACLNLLNSISPDADTAIISSAVVFAVLLIIGVIMHSAVNNTLIQMKVKLSN